jgi:DNA-binding transcriptional regulator YiaG
MIQVRVPAMRAKKQLPASKKAMTTNDEILNSWKEVASYMGRGVRTVQRWEQELGLPVRRPRGRSRSAVIAFKSELDTWLHRAPKELLQDHPEETPASAKPKYDSFERQAELRKNTELLLNKAKLLHSRSSDLREHLKVTQQRLSTTVRLTTVQLEHHMHLKTHVIVAANPKAAAQQIIRNPAQKHAIAS